MARSQPQPETPDLTVRSPRPLDAELDGYAWLPRMLDKARATVAGTAGDYLFGCPVDHTCLARLGVGPDLILDLVRRHDDDSGVLAALREAGIPSAAEAWFDAPAVEDELQATGSYLRVRPASGLAQDDARGRVFAGADHGAGGLSVVVIDAAAGERPPMHAHPTEEVVAVLSGAAMFRLGQWQARIVRAGEVVRVPAGCAHAWESLGPERLSAVAAYAAGAVVTTTVSDSD